MLTQKNEDFPKILATNGWNEFKNGGDNCVEQVGSLQRSIERLYEEFVGHMQSDKFWRPPEENED